MLGDGYGLIPNTVLYSNELTDKQKLLFCAISNLCAEKGYCRASNEYIGNLLGVNKWTISKNIATLHELGFIVIEESIQRKITLAENDNGVVKNHNGGCEKSQGGVVKNHNIILQENITIKKKENLKRKFLEFVYLTDEEYNKLIEQYGVKVVDAQIENLNNYIGQNGKDKYKSHYHTLLNWINRAGIKKLPSKKQSEYEISDGVYDIDKLLNNLPS